MENNTEGIGIQAVNKNKISSLAHFTNKRVRVAAVLSLVTFLVACSPVSAVSVSPGETEVTMTQEEIKKMIDPPILESVYSETVLNNGNPTDMGTVTLIGSEGIINNDPDNDSLKYAFILRIPHAWSGTYESGKTNGEYVQDILYQTHKSRGYIADILYTKTYNDGDGRQVFTVSLVSVNKDLDTINASLVSGPCDSDVLVGIGIPTSEKPGAYAYRLNKYNVSVSDPSTTDRINAIPSETTHRLSFNVDTPWLNGESGGPEINVDSQPQRICGVMDAFEEVDGENIGYIIELPQNDQFVDFARTVWKEYQDSIK